MMTTHSIHSPLVDERAKRVLFSVFASDAKHETPDTKHKPARHHIPTYLEYTLFASATSSVPPMMARPSGKMVSR